jgi:two-component system, NtrC family, sensor kinase
MSEGLAPLPLRHSLRAKGLLATLALLGYLLGAGLYIAGERERVFNSMQALESLSRHEKSLALTSAAVASALVDVSEASNAGQAEAPPVSDLRLYMEACARMFEELGEHDPSYALVQRSIERSYGSLQAQPVRANWIDLRETLRRASDDLDIRYRRLVDERATLNTGYHRQYDAVTVESLLLGLLGLAAFGTLAAWFFARLARDIRRLQEHALAIVRGSRGVAMDVKREDELGRLMGAVNRMAEDLDARERHIELDAQSRSHQDKMLAVGALAAGVAHEVNNPLAVITGVAQELQALPEAPTREQLAQSAQLILSHAQRAGQAARQLAEMAAPQPAEMDWVDLNALLRQAVQLLGYDRRYRRFAFDLQADAGMPAVRTSAQAVQQVLGQLLSLVCDALAAHSQLQPVLQLRTTPHEGGAVLQILFAPVLDFSRGEVQRSLLLCRAIVEPLRGQLAFGQVPGPLQRIQLSLPADAGGDEG